MNPRWTGRIARWAAATALGIVLVVAGLSVRRAWLASQALRHAPPAVPSNIEQRSLQFTFSQSEGRQIVFRIRAAQATEYKEQNRSLLEDVDIAVYGEHGERNDRIETRACDYVPSTGSVACSGRVDLELSNAAATGNRAMAGAGGIRIETSGVLFDRGSGVASTNSEVKFSFPQGHGRAVGVTYSSRNPVIAIHRNADFTLAPSRPGQPETNITAACGLRYDRATGELRLNGPVRITEGSREIETAALNLELDRQLRPRHASAGPGVRMEIGEGARRAAFRAQSAEIFFDARGRASRLEAAGGVEAAEGPPNAIKLEARRASIALNPQNRQPRSVVASGDVRVESEQQGRSSQLLTDTLYLATGPASPQGGGAERGAAAGAMPFRLERAWTAGRAQGDWNTGDERLHVEAGRLDAAFQADNTLRELRGTGGVRTDRQQPGTAPLLTQADTLRVETAGKGWIHMEESGGVRMRQGARSASADKAEMSPSGNEMALEGNASVSDGAGETRAGAILLNEQSGRMEASGGVRSTYFAAQGSGTGVAPGTGPAHVVADRLEANAKQGEAVYTGHARLWQGSLALQANRIELRQPSGELNATGDVRGIFPQVPRNPAVSGKTAPGTRSAQAGPVLWRVEAQTLRYANPPRGAAAGRATLGGGVQAWSSDAQMSAEQLVLTLGRDAAGRAELVEASGDGGVRVGQGKRWGTAEEGVYEAGRGKFVLTGGNPALHDTSGDLVTGDKLTFYVSDDTILIESKNGSRTVTVHPVPK